MLLEKLNRAKSELFEENKDKIEKQHKLGKLTARERIDLLLDAESFSEIDQLACSQFLKEKFYTDGVVAGMGKINGQHVAVYAFNFGFYMSFHSLASLIIAACSSSKIACPLPSSIWLNRSAMDSLMK